jgi:rhamnose utilization protein RhaD (predicted bifunctional aldolase and dehydrogenase)
MKNLWDPKEAAQFEENTLQMRVYSSRLLGQNSDLVLHGGGNTSVKVREINFLEKKKTFCMSKAAALIWQRLKRMTLCRFN